MINENTSYDPLLPVPTIAPSASPIMARINSYEIAQPAPHATLFQVDVNASYNGRSKLLVANEYANRQKIMNVLTVVAGEEHFEPTWGSRIQYRLFESVSPGTADDIHADTIGALTSFMSDTIQVLHGQCSVTVMDDGEGYNVDIYYMDKRTRQLDSFRFPMLAKGRG